MLVNISGHLTIAEVLPARGPRLRRPRPRVHPGLAHGPWRFDSASAGMTTTSPSASTSVRPACPIPECGIDWIPTLPPVVLEQWPWQPPAVGPPASRPSATMALPFGPLEIGGQTMGLKHHQFRRFLELPGRVPGAGFELALDIHPGDSADLERAARSRLEGRRPAPGGGDAGEFRDYVHGSAPSSRSLRASTSDTAERLVQRSDRRLPGGRPAGARAGHRRRRRAAARGGASHLLLSGGGGRGARADRRRSCRARPRRPRFRRGAPRLRLVLGRLLARSESAWRVGGG